MISPQLAAFISAELVFLLVRKKDIEILIKRKSQRELEEQHQVERGLYRSVIFEGALFVPASTALVLLFAPLITGFLESLLMTIPNRKEVIYAALGIFSYSFPFSALRRYITNMALRQLRNYEALLENDNVEKVNKRLREDSLDELDRSSLNPQRKISDD